jgi:signal transduction histidine kinase
MNSIAHDVAAIARIDVVPKILEVMCRTTGMGFAAVARVTDEKWVACAVRDEIAFGLVPGGELELTTTICHEIRQSGQAVVIDNVAEDPLFADHHTPRLYGLQSYISVPIEYGGAFFGTLCAIDPRPAKLRDSQALAMFELFAQLIGGHLDAQERMARTEAALLDARETAELREQFIAVLGHDLRNPLASIDGGVRLLLKTPLNERAVTLAGLVQKSVRRAAELIDDVMDLARVRLGGGFHMERRGDSDLAGVLTHVVAELKTSHTDRRIEIDIALAEPVECDSRRVAQLLSNLLANALTHGSAQTPVRVRARAADGVFELSVANGGAPIPPAALRGLFQPFTRAAHRPHQEGLGLGLYIASEIARAHEGTLTVASDPAETRFTFTMPSRAA